MCVAAVPRVQVHVHYSTATEDAGHYHMSHNADDPPLDTATLKQQMAAHKFLFVAGPHHSGTTLMSLLVGRNSHTAGLVNTSVPQGEGQHLQSMYPKAYNLGGMTRYAFNPDSRITETSVRKLQGARFLVPPRFLYPNTVVNPAFSATAATRAHTHTHTTTTTTTTTHVRRPYPAL